MQLQFSPDQWPRRIQVAMVMGDCHSSAVTRRPAVAHAGGVKVNAFPLHVCCLMALLKPYEVFLGPCRALGLSLAFYPGALLHDCLHGVRGEGHRVGCYFYTFCFASVASIDTTITVASKFVT